jgi:hypothetical protein
MRLLLTTLIMTAILAGGCLTQSDQEVCLEANSTPVLLTGHLERQEIEDPLDASPQQIWVLSLPKPITVAVASYEMPERLIPHHGIRRLQMVLRSKQYRQLAPLVGQQVEVSGPLFPGVNHHHHTAVLIDVTDVRVAQDDGGAE